MAKTRPTPRIGDTVRVLSAAFSRRERTVIAPDRRGRVVGVQTALAGMETEPLYVVEFSIREGRDSMQVLVPPRSILRVLPSPGS